MTSGKAGHEGSLTLTLMAVGVWVDLPLLLSKVTQKGPNGKIGKNQLFHGKCLLNQCLGLCTSQKCHFMPQNRIGSLNLFCSEADQLAMIRDKEVTPERCST